MSDQYKNLKSQIIDEYLNSTQNFPWIVGYSVSGAGTPSIQVG